MRLKRGIAHSPAVSRGLTQWIATGETLLDPDRPRETTLAALLQELDEPTLREAVTICAERQYLEDRGESMPCGRVIRG